MTDKLKELVAQWPHEYYDRKGRRHDALIPETSWVHADELCRRCLVEALLAEQAPAVCDKQFHMFVWTRSPRWFAVAQAENVERAREAMIEEIESSHDGSCPEREAADKWVRENTPSIYHFRNAEFALTDSAELREQELLSETYRKENEELKKQLAAGRSSKPIETRDPAGK